MEGIGADDLLDFLVELVKHCLVEVAIASTVVWAGCNRIYVRPPSERPWKSDDEECKAQVRDSHHIQQGSHEED